MATRASARNRNKPKVDYNDNDSDAVTSTKPARKPRGTKGSAKSTDDTDENNNNTTNNVPAKKPRSRKPANKAAAAATNDQDDGKTKQVTRGKRNAKAPSSVPEDKEMITKKQKIEEKIDTNIEEEESDRSSSG